MLKFLLPLFLLWNALALNLPVLAGDSLYAEMVSRNLVLDPGRVHHFTFRVSNPTDVAATIFTDIRLPEGIRLAVPMRPLTIEPGETGVRLVSITIPRYFLSGSASMEALFHTGDALKAFSRLPVDFLVKEVEGFSFELFSKPDYVMGGDRITAVYLLKNTGNNKRRFLLEPYNCKLETSPAVMLGPGESTTVQISAQTLRQLSSASSYSFSVEVYLSEVTRKRDFQSVRVYPLREEEEDLYFRYPVTLTSRYLARGREGSYTQGYQLEAFGSGYLDTARNHNLEFMARGPNNFDLSFMGLYDEYYISYKNKNLSTFAGSKSYVFTPLTEAARYGYGTENIVTTNQGHRAGFIYVEPRFYRDIVSEMAGFAEMNVYRGNRLGAYLFSKKNLQDAEDDRMVSVTARINPVEGTYADLEYSEGTKKDKADYAWRINLDSRYRQFGFSGLLIHAAPEYPGYYRNTTFYNGNLSLAITRSLSASVSAREDFSNAALDTLLFEAPYTRMLQSALNYRVSRSLELRAFYSGYERRDRMPVKKFDYHTESVNLLISQTLSRFTSQLWGELGKTENRLSETGQQIQRNSYRVNFSLGYRPSTRFYFQGFTSFTNINSFIAPEQNNWLWGVSANAQPGKNLRASMQLQNSYSIEDTYRNRNLFQFSLDYSFLRRHKLSANSYYTLFQNETGKPDYSASLTYSVKIGIPLRKTGEAGSVTGTVYDPSGNPVQGIVLYMAGRSTVTMGNGMYEFRNIPPGIYHLAVDRKNLDMNVIPDRPSPVTVEIFSGAGTQFNLNLVKAARVKGYVEAGEEASPAPGTTREPASLGNIIIDLKDGAETLRLITNPDGSFDFPMVRPGNWVLHIHPGSIDAGYRVQSESLQLILEQGVTKEIRLVLVPKTRNVIFRTVANMGVAETKE